VCVVGGFGYLVFWVCFGFVGLAGEGFFFSLLWVFFYGATNTGRRHASHHHAGRQRHVHRSCVMIKWFCSGTEAHGNRQKAPRPPWFAVNRSGHLPRTGTSSAPHACERARSGSRRQPVFSAADGRPCPIERDVAPAHHRRPHQQCSACCARSAHRADSRSRNTKPNNNRAWTPSCQPGAPDSGASELTRRSGVPGVSRDS